MPLKKDFRKWAKEHPNFMTPHIVKLYEKDDKIIEVSEGRGFDEKEMYGVSIAKKTPEGWKMQEGGKPFFNRQEAFDYAHRLREKSKMKDVS